ncbi:MAG: hypothetical protein GX051_07530 [Clostridiales bacterium]|nr:hypothetical protein [Clostridiales bacterium]
MKKTLKSFCALLAALMLLSAMAIPVAAIERHELSYDEAMKASLKKTSLPTVTFTDADCFATVESWYNLCALFQNFQGIKSGKIVFTYNPLVLKFNEELSRQGVHAEPGHDDGISYSRTFPEAGRMEIEFTLAENIEYEDIKSSGTSYFLISTGAFDVLSEGELNIAADITEIEYYEGAAEGDIEKLFCLTSSKSYTAQQLPFIGTPVIFPKAENLTVAEGTTVREYINSISAKNVVVTDAEGKVLSGNDVLRTGAHADSYYLGTLVDCRVISVMGDIDMDGVSGASDARYLLRVVTGLEEGLSAAQLAACGTSTPSAQTARELLRQATGLE